MSDVIAIRVPKKLKEELAKMSLDYSEGVRECLEKMVKKKKIEQKMTELEKFRNKLEKEIGLTSSSADIIREDRDRAH
jgi:hypothetical protein